MVNAEHGTGSRDIVLKTKDNELHSVNQTHRSYDSLQYPLLFPRGEDGYCLTIWQRNPQTNQPTGQKVSAKDLYAYRMMKRGNEFNILHHGKNLSNQFYVDMYVKIETERLQYIRFHQNELRTEQYVHLQDAIADDRHGNDIGQLVILPSSFIGGPRYMHEKTQDAMAYVRRYGRPSLFITITCNPKWPEIANELEPTQSPQDRHDLIARVFRLKMQRLMKLINQKSIFGATRCHIYTIEWQKRGLPHAHLLLWLIDRIQPRDIDKVISAELPDPQQDRELFDIVKKHMIHGPCGHLNRNSPCMKNGKCTKKYPRSFVSETQTGDDGYPRYRRRAPSEGGQTEEIRTGLTVDNRWVVPYNPFLSRKFNAHINVEYCNSVKSIKYVCKYIHKGCDMAVFGAQQSGRRDEVKRFQTGRYVSTNEAVWRILAFPIHDRDPSVEQLPVHLENGQRVYFTPENAHERALEPPGTKLTAFFDLCRRDEFARTLLYNRVPEHYTWNSKAKRWNPRKQCPAIGRVYNVHPNNVECFHLRLLLHTVPGPTNFDELKTVDGTICQTFHEACARRGLLDDDNHWNQTLQEATLCDSPSKIRDMFAIMLHMCSLTDPKKLWDDHKEAMAEDYLRNARRIATLPDMPYTEAMFNAALTYIENKVLSFPSGKTLDHFGLPRPNREDPNFDENPAELLAEQAYDRQELQHIVNSREPTLTHEQRIAYRTFQSFLQREQEHNIFFLDAPGGTGKTYLLNLFLAKVRSQGDIALATASSGIAATLLMNGKTAHSTLKIPLDLTTTEKPTCNISKRTAKARLLKQCKVIIWDECTMTHKLAYEAVDRTLQDLRRNPLPMGGVIMVLAGDFRQTLPVVPRGTRADEINACLKSSLLWQYVKSAHLTKNMRTHLFGDRSAESYSKTLMDIGDGKIPIDPLTGLIEIPCGHLVESQEELENSVFPDIAENHTNVLWLCERAILAPTNNCVDSINESLLHLIPQTTQEYLSIDTPVEIDDAVNYPAEFLNSLNPSGMPLHELHVKIGCPVMLLRNLDPPKLCNGTKLIVKKLMPHIIEAEIAQGTYKSEIVLIPRIPLIPSDTTIPFKRLQFPIRLCFAMTINKAQGQTLKTVGISLFDHCFAHGQFYVACSRISSAENLYILSQSKKTANIVYPEVLTTSN